MATKILYHVTLNELVPAIGRQGLLASKARRKRNAVWVVHREHVLWAVAHTAVKPWARGRDLAIYSVKADPLDVVLHNRNVYYIRGDVSPERLRLVKVVRSGRFV